MKTLLLSILIGFQVLANSHIANTTVSIANIILKAKFNDTIWVEAGEYKGPITLKRGITLISSEKHKAIITGGGRSDIVTMSQKSSLIGFSVCNGNTGIVNRNSENIIKDCKIYKNRGTGIMCIGTIPDINNCIIVFNGGSGIQAIDVSTGAAQIIHNTIAFNENNGIALYTNAPTLILDNIIAYNNSKGLKIEGKIGHVTITNNCLYKNFGSQKITIKDNFYIDPMFRSPRRRTLDFTLLPKSEAINKSTDSINLGVRF